MHITVENFIKKWYYVIIESFEKEKQMNALKFIKKAVTNACVYFTISEFALLILITLVQKFAAENGGTAVMFLNLGATALIFLACLCLAALNFVWKLNCSVTARIFIHYFGMLAAFSLVFIVIPRAWDNPIRVAVIIGAYTVIYLIIGLIAAVINSIKRNRKSEEIEYESQFGEITGRK